MPEIDVTPEMPLLERWRIRDHRIKARTQVTKTLGRQPHPLSEREANLVYAGRLRELAAIPAGERPTAELLLDIFRKRHGLDLRRVKAVH